MWTAEPSLSTFSSKETSTQCHGQARRGDELSTQLSRQEQRLTIILAAKAVLEQEAQADAPLKRAAPDTGRGATGHAEDGHRSFPVRSLTPRPSRTSPTRRLGSCWRQMLRGVLSPHDARSPILCAAQSDRRTGVWPDQAGPWLSTICAARNGH